MIVKHYSVDDADLQKISHWINSNQYRDEIIFRDHPDKVIMTFTVGIGTSTRANPQYTSHIHHVEFSFKSAEVESFFYLTWSDCLKAPRHIDFVYHSVKLMGR